jgi:hypothetical protein
MWAARAGTTPGVRRREVRRPGKDSNQPSHIGSGKVGDLATGTPATPASTDTAWLSLGRKVLLTVPEWVVLALAYTVFNKELALPDLSTNPVSPAAIFVYWSVLLTATGFIVALLYLWHPVEVVSKSQPPRHSRLEELNEIQSDLETEIEDQVTPKWKKPHPNERTETLVVAKLIAHNITKSYKRIESTGTSALLLLIVGGIGIGIFGVIIQAITPYHSGLLAWITLVLVLYAYGVPLLQFSPVGGFYGYTSWRSEVSVLSAYTKDGMNQQLIKWAKEEPAEHVLRSWRP